MPTHIPEPTIVPAVGEPPKIIREVAGRVNTGTTQLSLARMSSRPAGRSPASGPRSTR